jgi:foldase protein PrsA
VIRRAPLLAVALVAALAFATSCSAFEPPAAVVDGIRITDAQVAADVRLFVALSSLSRQSCGTVLPGEDERAACTRAALASLIQETFTKRYATAHHITADAGEVKTSEESLFKQLGGPATVEPVLRREHVDDTQFRDLAARIVLLRAVEARIGSAAVTDARLHELYRSNIQQYTLLHVEHILVKTKAQAERVYREVTRRGATERDFLALAGKVSIDPSARQNSGDLGSVSASSLDPTFVAAAEALRPGQVSRPVQTQFGWHVIRLVSKSVTPFENLRSELEQQASANAFDAWFTQQLSGAHVDVNPKYGKWDPKLKAVLPIRSTATGTPTVATTAPTTPPAVP